MKLKITASWIEDMPTELENREEGETDEQFIQRGIKFMKHEITLWRKAIQINPLPLSPTEVTIEKVL